MLIKYLRTLKKCFFLVFDVVFFLVINFWAFQYQSKQLKLVHQLYITTKFICKFLSV